MKQNKSFEDLIRKQRKGRNGKMEAQSVPDAGLIKYGERGIKIFTEEIKKYVENME